MSDGVQRSGLRRGVILAATALLAWTGTSHAQQGSPTIGYVYPAGGRQGTTFQVTVGGQFLAGIKNAHVSGQGVTCKIVEYVGSINQQKFEQLRDQMKELQERKRLARWGLGGLSSRPASQPAATRGATSNLALAATQPATSSSPASTQPWSDEDDRKIAELTERMGTFARDRVAQAFSDTVTLEMTIDADAPPGRREIRLEAGGGLTNPMVFCVGSSPEFSEKVAKGADRFGHSDDRPGARFQRRGEAPASEIEITLPAVVNGQILAGDVDRYTFTARKGQRLVAAAKARELVPYMAEAVPGWCQAMLTITDSKGNELACADHDGFNPDPALCCTIPSDGRYVLEVRDVLYRGREDFVYRVSLGELPFVKSVFPLGGPAGTQTKVQVSGFGLISTALTMDATSRRPGRYPLPQAQPAFGNDALFAVDDLPECSAKQPSGSTAGSPPGGDIRNAQPVSLPIIINGRIEHPGEWDVFSFQGQAGQKVVAEVTARRLGSQLDSAIKITDAAGKPLGFNDDWVDKAEGLMTHHADSYLMVSLPADGVYYVHLCDVQRKSGPEYGYRLRISAPRPDFALRVTPSAINIRFGETLPITVHAIRKDGFAGEISLALKDAPAGCSLGGATLPAGQDSIRITLTALRISLKGPVAVSLEGSARDEGREIAHTAVAADDMMQAFAYRHLVPAAELNLCLINRPFPRIGPKILSDQPVRIPCGGRVTMQVALPGGPMMGDVHVDLNEPPEGIALQETSGTNGQVQVVLRCDAAKAKPGTKGNLIFTLSTERNAPQGQPGNKRRTPLGVLPAVPFEVVGPTSMPASAPASRPSP